MKPDNIFLQLFSELREYIGAEIAHVRDEIREEGKRRDSFVMTMDTANKAEFAAVKGMVRDVERSISTLATREDMNRLDTRVLNVENRQTANMPLFLQMQEKLPKLESRVDSLEQDRTRAQGAWWLSSRIWVLIGGSSGFTALVVWWLERLR